MSGTRTRSVAPEKAPLTAEDVHLNDATTLREANPVLPVGDLAEALAFWEDSLGFAASFRYGEPPTYAGVRRGPVEVHLCAVDDVSVARQTQVRIRVENIELLYREYFVRGIVSPTGDLAFKPWGTREFGLYGPDGVAIVFL